MHRRHSGLSAALVCATLAIGTSSLTSGADAAPGEGSALALRAPARVVAESWDGRVFTDFGIRLTAPAGAFELWSTRASYDDPIRTEWRAADGTVIAELPVGTMTDFSGLPDFYKINVRRAGDGTVVRRQSQHACLNGWSQRIDPAAPATSPYPLGCPWNPYTLGSVMGIQQGHASSAGEFGYVMRLQPGRYDVTLRIAPEYVEMFGIAPEDTKRVTRLVVTEPAFGGFRGRRAAAPQSSPRLSTTTSQPADEEPSLDAAGVPPETQPDLRSLPAFAIGLNRSGTMLRFAATVWNGGDSPLVVDGFRPEGADHMDAYQYFYDVDGNETGAYQQIGTMHWHADNHQHWHFEDFAQYDLLNVDQTLAVRSTKQSFCLANTDAVDYTQPSADWNPTNTSLESDCGGPDALSVRQVLSAGSGDTYMQYRAGQAFPIKDLPNGVYWIKVAANPLGNLVESDAANNYSLREIRIGGTPSNRWVKAPQVGIVDESGFGFF